jgi:uncharacterized protein
VVNVAKHGVGFEEACVAFDDPDVLMEHDADPDEDRELTIGMGAGRVLFVVSTERGARTRIISARKATRDEQDRYHRAATHRR